MWCPSHARAAHADHQHPDHPQARGRRDRATAALSAVHAICGSSGFFHKTWMRAASRGRPPAHSNRMYPLSIQMCPAAIWGQPPERGGRMPRMRLPWENARQAPRVRAGLRGDGQAIRVGVHPSRSRQVMNRLAAKDDLAAAACDSGNSLANLRARGPSRKGSPRSRRRARGPTRSS